MSEVEWYNELVDDSCELDNAPKHLPFRFNVDKNNKVKDSWEDKWDNNHTHDKYWQQCKRIDALLTNSIGKPFDPVYSKVCNEYPKMMRWGMSLKDYFNNQFRTPRYYWYPYYFIDENGLIQYYVPEKKHTKKRQFVISKSPSEYVVNHDEIQNHTALMNTIYYKMGADAYYRLLDSDKITEKFYNEIKAATDYDPGVGKIIDHMVTRYVYDKNLHKAEYRKLKAEDEDFRKKQIREEKKRVESQRNGLVQYLTWKRKNEGRENDIQNRDRHGFDDKSFKKEKEE